MSNFDDCYIHRWEALPRGTSSEMPKPCPYCTLGELKDAFIEAKNEINQLRQLLKDTDT